jgi:hypothetical protein
MQGKMQDMYGFRYPIQRRVMEDRLSFLEKEFNKFDYMINPYHIQPGLLLDVDITSIKRKKATLDGMANVLNEFLHGVSKGFQDAAFASFSRRRSTVRDDISMHFATDLTAEGEEAEAGQSYLDMLNAPEPTATEEAEGSSSRKSSSRSKSSTRKKSSSSKKGVVDSGSKSKRGRKKKGSSDSELTTL